MDIKYYDVKCQIKLLNENYKWCGLKRTKFSDGQEMEESSKSVDGIYSHELTWKFPKFANSGTYEVTFIGIDHEE